MEQSRFNIIIPRPAGGGHFVVNLLSGNADLVSEEEAAAIRAGTGDRELVDKGYVVERAAEERRYRAAYLDFLDGRENDEIQLFYVPGYACNFDCAYCYQSSYGNKALPDQRPIIASFFHYIDTAFAEKRKYLTLFGGEPLLSSPAARGHVEALLTGAAERRLDTAVVTNGYTLIDYLPLLKDYSIREIQVTLDGLADTHNRRRPLAGGGPTFDRIVAGIDAALETNLPVNLRVILDQDNIGELAALARFAAARGWTGHPSFKTQLGRAYELHTCLRGREKLYSRLSFYQALAAEIKKDPGILAFHRPAFSMARFLFENDRLPAPLFDSCPGAKTEWAFDGTGKIYSCTAAVGKQGEELGEFYPAVSLREDLIARWQERDVTAIPQCRACALQLACGGGCAAVALNRDGNIMKPDCRPVKELLALGLPLYTNKPTEALHV